MRRSEVELPRFIQELISDPIKFRDNRNKIELFSENEIQILHDLTIKLEMVKPNVHELGNNFDDTLIIGDIHGDIHSLVRITRSFFESKAKSMIFLGDYVDRGKDSLLVFCYLMSINLAYPENIQLLRGNHEDSNLNRRYGFSRELDQHYPDPLLKEKIADLLDEIFNFLSLSAITPRRSMCMHGGIPFGNPSIIEINEIPKPHFSILKFEEPHKIERLKLHMDGLMWNDPSEHIQEDFEQSPRGFGLFLFSENALSAFLEKNSLMRIVRAHESSRGGFENLFAGKVLHIFSTEPYFNKVPDAYILHETTDRTIVRDLDFNPIKSV